MRKTCKDCQYYEEEEKLLKNHNIKIIPFCSWFNKKLLHFKPCDHINDTHSSDTHEH